MHESFQKTYYQTSQNNQTWRVISHSAEIAYRSIQSQCMVPVINVRQLGMANQCSFGFLFQRTVGILVIGMALSVKLKTRHNTTHTDFWSTRSVTSFPCDSFFELCDGKVRSICSCCSFHRRKKHSRRVPLQQSASAPWSSLCREPLQARVFGQSPLSGCRTL